jgi:hypothetical protein
MATHLNKCKIKKSREERESFWIRKLKTLSPNAINEKK